MQPINNGQMICVYVRKNICGDSNYESHERNKTLCMIKRAALV